MATRKILYGVTVFMMATLLACGGCQSPQAVTVTGQQGNEGSAFVLQGQQAARLYARGDKPDYELVIEMRSLSADQRAGFLEGFGSGLTEVGRASDGASYRAVLAESVRGNQFETARDFGSRHAAKAVTNEQIQGLIRSALGISRGVALGWKAGYVEGFASQRVADAAATGPVTEGMMQGYRAEAMVVYEALRAAIGD